MSWSDAVPGLVLDPWRFDPSAAVEAANLAVAGGPAIVQSWAEGAASMAEATAATIVVRLVVEPAPVRGQADTFRPDAPAVPHHPFLLAHDVPFLPASVLTVGGGGLGPVDFVRSCLANGTFRTAPLAPAAPLAAAAALIGSPEWHAVIDPSSEERAARMVRWQAARALRRPELLEGIDPANATAEELRTWWTRVEG